MFEPFTELSITLANPDVTLPDFFKAVCVAVVKTIPNADRVSLWKFSQGKSDITCLALWVNQEFSQPISVVCSEQRYPGYFKAILERHSLLAIDARNHPDTSCFADNYLESESVFSLMGYVL